MLAVVVASIAGTAGTVDARPKRRDAKAEFNRGVAAYQKGNFEVASAALAKSFELERDVETLFAWAQAERKLDHCDKAIDLYEKLLASNLPDANKSAVEQKLTECRAIVAQQKPPEPAPGASAPGGPAPLELTAESQPGGAEHAGSAPSASPLTDTRPGSHAWYKDPIALSLVGTGAVATGVGVGFLISAKSLDSDFKSTKDYQKAQDFSDKAKSRGNIGLVATGVGGALVIGGVVWIVTHRDATEQHALTGWVSPGGGGLAVAGAF